MEDSNEEILDKRKAVACVRTSVVPWLRQSLTEDVGKGRLNLHKHQCHFEEFLRIKEKISLTVPELHHLSDHESVQWEDLGEFGPFSFACSLSSDQVVSSIPVVQIKRLELRQEKGVALRWESRLRSG